MSGIGSRVPSHRGAARDRHGRGAGCGGRGCAFDERREKRTVKSCGPAATTLASSSRKRGRRWQTSPVAGESTKEAVKTTARGMPGVSGVTVVTNARVFYTTRAAAGASGARHSLRPLISESGTNGKTSRQTGGEIAKLRREDTAVKIEIGVHANTFVMPGLDPGIHPSSGSSFEEDGLPGQARQ